MLLAFLRHAEQHYRGSDGKTTNEYEEYKVVARYVRELYGEIPALNFGPLALKAIRQKFIEARWSRGFINQRVGRIRRIFKWATSEELVPATVFQSLATVTGLQRGRTKAKETKPVLSVTNTSTIKCGNVSGSRKINATCALRFNAESANADPVTSRERIGGAIPGENGKSCTPHRTIFTGLR